jgi:hypothetical protein
MTNGSNKKLNIFANYTFNSFHLEKLRNLIDDKNISVDRFRYLCSAISTAEKEGETYWLPKSMC